MVSNPKSIRSAAGWSRWKVAIHAATTDATVRLYELDPNAVRADKRDALDLVYARLRALLEQRDRAAA